MKSGELSGILKAGAFSIPMVGVITFLLDGEPWIAMWVTVMAVGLDVLWGIIMDIPNSFLVDWWEHYHWGLLFLSLSQIFPRLYFLLGIGLYLVEAEAFHNHPFSYGEENFPRTTLVGILMTIVTVISFAYT